MTRRILIPTLIFLAVLTLAVSSVSASSPALGLPVGTERVTLVPGNYCVSCHLADDPRLQSVTEWNGSIAREVDNPCPAATKIHEELYYTERLLLMIDRAQAEVGALPEKAQSRLDGYTQRYSRLLDAPVTSLDAFVSEAQTARFQMNKAYTTLNQMAEAAIPRTFGDIFCQAVHEYSFVHEIHKVCSERLLCQGAFILIFKPIDRVLIECKCTKSIFNPFDQYRARKHIEDAIEQLNYRKNSILANWQNFYESAGKLGLPLEPINSERICMITVTNVLEFTGWWCDGVIVTDEFCVRRFFSNPEVEALQFSQNGISSQGVVGRIRKSDIPTSAEFLSYLKDPPQAKVIRDCLELVPMAIPRLSKNDPQIAMLMAVYRPEKNPLKAMHSNLRNENPPKRKRHHKK